MADIIVVGGDGLIGRALFHRLKSMGKPVKYTSRNKSKKSPDCIYLDLAESIDINEVPQTVFVCAGISNLSQCEKDPSGTRSINIDSIIALVENLYTKGSHIIYLSSQSVFDGLSQDQSIDSPTTAVIEYGKQKIEAEQRILALGQRTAVIRMSKVISRRVPIIGKWLESLMKGETIYPFKDLFLSPISLDFVVSVLAGIKCRGIVHISNEDQLSYAEFGLRLAKGFGLPLQLVQPVTVEGARVDLVHNPRFTRLDMTHTTDSLGIKPQPLMSTINDVVREFS
jgi:dTDP-4-dehydrorhamnose reductase